MVQPSNEEIAYIEQVVDAEAEAALNILSATGCNLSGLTALVENAYEYTEQMIAKYQQQAEDDGYTLACHRGCAHCCHILVEVTPPEVLYLLRYLSSPQTPVSRNKVRMHVAQAYESIRQLSRHEREITNIPCAFLVNDCCAIYPIRPLTCRGWNSFNEAQCIAGYQQPTKPIHTTLIAEQLWTGRAVAMGMR